MLTLSLSTMTNSKFYYLLHNYIKENQLSPIPLNIYLSNSGEEMVEISVIKFVTVIVLVASCISVQFAEGRVRQYKWEVKYEYKSPDCYKKLAITINGRTPGPSIVAQQGDTIVVELKNSLLTENVAIHWHGIRQVHTVANPGF